MAHLLLPTDLSDASFHAAAFAVHLFGRTGNRFSFFHAYADTPIMDPALAMSMPGLIKEADEQLHAFADRFTRITGAEGVQRELVYGPLVPLLEDRASRDGVDLIVMGREGKGASFFGSNSVAVIKRSSVPVLVVPANAPVDPPKRILLADDRNDVRVRDLSILRAIALRAKADVLVAHYVQDVAEGLPHWSNGIYALALKDVPHAFLTAHGHGPVDGLEQLAGYEQADMIAVLHRHIGFLERLFTPSTSKELALHARYPLLVMEQGRS